MITCNKTRRAIAVLLVAAAVFSFSATAGAATNIYATAGGTLADGGVYGPRDGNADSAIWTFNQFRFSGAVTMINAPVSTALEHRMVFEFDLRSLVVEDVTAAKLVFKTRGVTVSPFPDSTLQVVTYPADLVALPGDYSAAASGVLASVNVVALSSTTTHELDVRDLVLETIQQGNRRLGIRLQLDPVATVDHGQVFIDGDDDDPESKPFLRIGEAVSGGACCFEGACSDVARSADCGFACNVTTNALPECGGPCNTTCFGDVNGDGTVTAADRGFISANIGAAEAALICQYDLDGNGVVAPSDRGFVAANIGACTALPDYQDGSGTVNGQPDERFGTSRYFPGQACAQTNCAE